MDVNLEPDFLRVTEKAAIAAARTMGYGDRKYSDQIAVEAMRKEMDSLAINGTVVIGEGERDKAPMLYVGEKVGADKDGRLGYPEIDIAVDPLEGTNLCATGSNNAIAVLAAAISAAHRDVVHQNAPMDFGDHGGIFRTGCIKMPFVELNHAQCKTYLVGSETGRKAVLIDPLKERIDRYLAVLAYHGYRLEKIIDTHTHADHRSGAAELSDLTEAPVVMHRRGAGPAAPASPGPRS